MPQATTTRTKPPTTPEHSRVNRVAAWWHRRTPTQKTLIALGLLLLVYAFPLRGVMREQGSPMEEGFMLVFPERFLHGALPNRDFLHLYGPGSVWVLAGWYKVFGVSLAAERWFGLIQEFAIIFGVYAIARFWGRTAAFPCALLSLIFILPPLGLTALAWVGGVGLGLLGLAAAMEARRRSEADEGRASLFAVLGGLLAGMSVLYRLDLIVAVGLGSLVVLWGTHGALKRRFLAGTGIGALGYIVQAAWVGPYVAFKGMVLDPVVYLRGGRRLPIPPPWERLDGFLQRTLATVPPQWQLPSLTTPQQLSIWFFVMLAGVAFLVGVAVWSFRRDPRRFRARVLLAAALFSVGLVPQGIQRVDSAHFAWVSCVGLAFVPLAILELLDVRRPTTRSVRRRNLLVGGSFILAICLLIPYFTAWPYEDFIQQSLDRHRIAVPISRNGRVFYYGRTDVQRDATALLKEVPKIAKPGEKLFVGTSDLRKTPYSDAWLYFLLPEYPPGTYYIEMDPDVANAKNSRLAKDLASSDIAILSTVWNEWDEPNDSRKFGPDKPNEVLRQHFCLVERFGTLYSLYKKCR
ncbi:MAG TPA: hypothetical protein VIC35_02850 [Acidimicrobiia bacterium]|jgi:hypothetical protein